MVRNHQFNMDEIRLATLRRMNRGLSVGLVVCLFMAATLVLASVVVAPKIPEAVYILLLALPFLLGCAVCFVWLPKVKDEFAELRSWQRNCFLLRQRKEWRNQHDSMATPDWKVIDKWEKGRHLYGLVEPGDINGEPKRWYDPLRRPRPRKVTKNDPKNIKR